METELSEYILEYTIIFTLAKALPVLLTSFTNTTHGEIKATVT